MIVWRENGKAIVGTRPPQIWSFHVFFFFQDVNGKDALFCFINSNHYFVAFFLAAVIVIAKLPKYSCFAHYLPHVVRLDARRNRNVQEHMTTVIHVRRTTLVYTILSRNRQKRDKTRYTRKTHSCTHVTGT